MKTINLFFDFEFTSLSPDAQPISLGIVSEEYWTEIMSISLYEYEKRKEKGLDVDFYKLVPAENGNINAYYQPSPFPSKSFYAEFSDFDLNRCDDWVKENVVSKLRFYQSEHSVESFFIGSENIPKCPEFCIESNDGLTQCLGNTDKIKQYLKDWLAQFSDYQIQFICDCGTFDWYWMLQLLAKWDVVGIQSKADMGFIPAFRIGLPTLPINISPVPQDLNDLIAFKKGISAKEAFDLNRETFVFENIKGKEFSDTQLMEEFFSKTFNKHNAIWDAKVIKAIYEKLNA